MLRPLLIRSRIPATTAITNTPLLARQWSTQRASHGAFSPARSVGQLTAASSPAPMRAPPPPPPHTRAYASPAGPARPPAPGSPHELLVNGLFLIVSVGLMYYAIRQYLAPSAPPAGAPAGAGGAGELGLEGVVRERTDTREEERAVWAEKVRVAREVIARKRAREAQGRSGGM